MTLSFCGFVCFPLLKSLKCTSTQFHCDGSMPFGIRRGQAAFSSSDSSQPMELPLVRCTSGRPLPQTSVYLSIPLATFLQTRTNAHVLKWKRNNFIQKLRFNSIQSCRDLIRRWKSTSLHVNKNRQQAKQSHRIRIGWFSAQQAGG